MALPITCPHCSARFAAGPQLAGRRVRCPKCRGPIEIPAAAADSSAEAGNGAENRGRQSAHHSEHHIGSAEAVSVAALEHPEADDEGSVGFGGKERADNAEMDMTPMVDVTFLLLIFFMVTASFSMQKTMQLPRSKSEDPSIHSIPDPPEEEPEPITVYVDSYNTFTVETSSGFQEAPSEQELLIALRDAMAMAGEAPQKLVVKAHIDSRHEKAVAALDAGAEVGIMELQYTTITEDP